MQLCTTVPKKLCKNKLSGVVQGLPSKSTVKRQVGTCEVQCESKATVASFERIVPSGKFP